LLLAQSGEFGLALFGYAYESEMLETALFQQLLLVVVLSMLATPPLAFLARRLAAADMTPASKHHEKPVKAPVVIAGFGRVGRRIGKILTSAGVPYVAIDSDSSLVLHERDNGHPVFYGDGRVPDVLRSAGAANARLVIVTVNDLAASEDIVAALHREHPGVTILARGHNADWCRELQKLGAAVAVSENLGASLDLAREALTHEQISDDVIDSLLRRFRADYYAEFEADSGAGTPGPTKSK